MSRRTPTRSSGHQRPRRQRPIVANTLQLVLRQATRLTAAEHAHVTQPLHAAWAPLRAGVGTLHHWQIVDSHNSLSSAIEAQGIVRGLAGHLTLAHEALRSIYARAWSGHPDPTVVNSGHWTPTPLHWHEMDHIGTGIELLDYQVQQLSARELAQALDRAINSVTQAGGRAVSAQHTGVAA